MYFKTSIFVIVLCVTYTCHVQASTFIKDTTITLGQKAILDKFRKIMKSKVPHEYMKEDMFLIRWLRNAYFDISRAEQNLMKYIQWRKEENIDRIHEEDWSDMKREYKYTFKPRSKDGKPTLYFSLEYWDLRQAALSGRTARLLRYVDKILDEAAVLVRQEGKKYGNVSQAVVIVNGKGFSLAQHGCLQCIPMILRVISSYEAHIPGYADKILLINVPQAADPIIRLARAAFHPDTNKVLFVYGTNKSRWKKVLNEIFEKDQIPIDIGGNLLTEIEDDTF